MHPKKVFFTLEALVSDFYYAGLLQSASEMDIFKIIHMNELTLDEIALQVERLPTTNIARHSLSLILKALVSMNLLIKASSKYAVNPLYTRKDLLPIFLLKEEFLAAQTENREWLNINAIVSGQLSTSLDYKNGLLKGNITKFNGIQCINNILGKCVVEEFSKDFANASYILDIGGGDGIFSNLLLNKYQNLRVDIVDLDDGGSSPAQYLKEKQHWERLKIINADAREFSSSKKYDLIVINELLELFPYPEKVKIIEMAFKQLNQQGKLLITKFNLDKHGLEPLSSAVFSLRMRMKSECSYLETNEELIQMLRSCGFYISDYKCLDGIKSIFKAEILNIASPNSEQVSLQYKCDCQPISISSKVLLPKMDQLKYEMWSELMSIASSYRVPAILFASLELKIFECISTDGSTINEIKKKIDINDIAIDLIIKTLISLGILELKNSRVYLDSKLRTLLCPGEESMIEELLLYKKENNLWLNLAKIICNDSLRLDARKEIETNHIAEYLHLVSTGNQDSVKATIKKIKELNIIPNKITDIGGGKGDFSIGFCQEFPKVNCTILDLKHVINYHLSNNYSNESWFQRITFIEDDITEEANRESADLVVISDMLHYFDRTTKKRILNNALTLLEKGGHLIYHKFSLDPEGVEPLSAAMLSIRFNTKRPGAYLETDQEAMEILDELKMTHIHTTFLDHGKTLLIHRK